LSTPADPQKGATELANLRSAHRSLQEHVTRLQWLVQWGLLAAVLLVPLARLTDDEGRDTEHTLLSLFGAIGFFISADPDDLGGSKAHPYGVPGGRAVTVIGLFLVLVSGLATAATSAALRHPEAAGRVALAQQISAAVLLVGVVATWLGLVWLPDDDNDLSIGPAWGLLVALAAGVWASHSAWSSRAERVV